MSFSGWMFQKIEASLLKKDLVFLFLIFPVYETNIIWKYQWKHFSVICTSLLRVCRQNQELFTADLLYAIIEKQGFPLILKCA